MKNTFNVTKTDSITLTNENIQFIISNGRTAIMKELNIKESWAKKLKSAANNGDLVLTSDNTDTEFSLYYVPKAMNNNCGDVFGIGRYEIVTSASGKQMAKRLKPSNTAFQAYEAGCRTVEQFVEYAISMGISSNEGKTWFRRIMNWFF